MKTKEREKFIMKTKCRFYVYIFANNNVNVHKFTHSIKKKRK